MRALKDINLLNDYLIIDLVARFKPSYTVKLNSDRYCQHDAEVYDGDRLIFYVESKVRRDRSTKYPSALIDESKGLYLVERSKIAPTYVFQFFLGDDRTYVYKFAENGVMDSNVIRETRWCPLSTHENRGSKTKNVFLLPFKGCWNIEGMYSRLMEKLNAAAA